MCNVIKQCTFCLSLYKNLKTTLLQILTETIMVTNPSDLKYGPFSVSTQSYFLATFKGEFLKNLDILSRFCCKIKNFGPSRCLRRVIFEQLSKENF